MIVIFVIVYTMRSFYKLNCATFRHPVFTEAPEALPLHVILITKRQFSVYP